MIDECCGVHFVDPTEVVGDGDVHGSPVVVRGVMVATPDVSVAEGSRCLGILEVGIDGLEVERLAVFGVDGDLLMLPTCVPGPGRALVMQGDAASGVIERSDAGEQGFGHDVCADTEGIGPSDAGNTDAIGPRFA